VCILLEVRQEPVRGEKELALAFGICGAAKEIVVSQGVLRDCDGVVLAANLAVIVKLRDAVGVIDALVVGLRGKGHVIFTEVTGGGVEVFRGNFMPEGELALAAEKIGAENAAVVVQAGQGILSVSILRHSLNARVELRSMDSRLRLSPHDFARGQLRRLRWPCRRAGRRLCSEPGMTLRCRHQAGKHFRTGTIPWARNLFAMTPVSAILDVRGRRCHRRERGDRD